MNGTLGALRKFFVDQGLKDVADKAEQTMDSMDKSMQGSAKTQEAILEIFNELKRNQQNQDTPQLPGEINFMVDLSQDET